MVLQGRISQAPAGLIGFDTTDPLNPATAKQYFNKGYRYCLRYLSHNKNPKSQYDGAQIILDWNGTFCCGTSSQVWMGADRQTWP
jgi:hypothetical protein